MTDFWDRVTSFQGIDAQVYYLVWYPIASAWWVRNADCTWQLINDGGEVVEANFT